MLSAGHRVLSLPVAEQAVSLSVAMVSRTAAAAVLGGMGGTGVGTAAHQAWVPLSAESALWLAIACCCSCNRAMRVLCDAGPAQLKTLHSYSCGCSRL
jgi:hypothetical protein